MLLLAVFTNAVNAEDYVERDSIIYDFYELNADKDTVWYKVISEEDKTCEVTYSKGIYEEYSVEVEDSLYIFSYLSPDYRDTLRYVGTINIPSSATNSDNGETYKVVGIGENAFLNCNLLKEVTLPNTIEYVDSFAFLYSSLESIILPEGIDSIFYWAFSYTNLKTFNIPASLSFLDFEGILNGSDSLTNITVDPSNKFFSDNGEGVLYNYDKTRLLAYPANKEGKTYKVAETCDVLAKSSFEGAKNLKKVYLNEGLDTLEAWTFLGCSSLDSVNIPSTVRYIPNGSVFMENTSLATLEVDKENLYYVSKDNVIFNHDMTTLVVYAIGNERTSYSIPSTVKKIDYESFMLYQHLKKIEIPASVDTIVYASFICDDAVCWLDTIVCKSNDPAAVEYSETFESLGENRSVCYDNTVVVVPDGTKEIYESAEVWKLFKNIVEESKVTGINEINADNTPASATTDDRIYDLQGRRLDITPENGVYIRGGKKYLGS